MRSFFTSLRVALAVIFFSSSVQAQISVTATGGTPTGLYTTLSAAFAAVNAGTHTGAIVVQVTGNTTEPAAPTALLASGQGSSSYTSLLIQPTVQATISGATNPGSAVINLDGADNVTINGSIGGSTRDLTIENTAAGSVLSVAAIRLIGRTTLGLGATNVTIKNCIIKGSTPGNNGFSGSTVATTYGIYAGSTTATTMANGTGSADHDNLLIENNEISRAYIGIHVVGLVSPNQADNLIIRDNIIGSNTTAEEIGFKGVIIQQADTALVTRNEVFNINSIATVSPAGIEVGGSASLAVTVSANKIFKITNRNTGGYGAFGINFTNGANSVIVNNLIYGIEASNYNSASTSFNAFGIRFSGGNNHKVWYNSVNMFGNITVGGSTTNAIASALVVTSTAVAGLDIRNNVFSMKMTSSVPTPEFLAVWFPASYNFANAVLDNNAYMVPNIPGCYVGKVGGTFGTGLNTSLTNWRTISQVNNATNDVLSQPAGGNVAAPFTSDVDLTIPSGTVTPLESGAVAIPALGLPNVDYTNTARPAFSGIAPDMGAYEFNGSLGDFAPPALSGLNVDITGSACTNSPRVVTITATDNVGVDSLWLNYTYGGVAQPQVLMTLSSGTAQNGTWTGVIPAAPANNTSVTFSIFGVDAADNISATVNGTSYRDAYLTVNAFNDQTINTNTSTTVQATTNDPNRIKLVISEVIQFKTGTGAGTYPAYIPTADNDYVEISNLSNISANLSGYTLSVSGGVNSTYTFPAGVILPGNAVLVLAFSGSNNDFANRYFEMGFSGTTSSTVQNGYILKTPGGAIVDAVALNGYTFPGASGITAANWSGNIPTSSAGVRRTAGVDGNTAADWAISSSTNLTDVGVYNITLLPVAVTTFFSWTPGGLTTDTITVGPFANPGVNVFTASYADGVCTSTDSVVITVVPPITPVADFSATPLLTVTGTTVTFTDLSQNVPSSWNWVISPATFSFVGGTSASSQNPQVQFSATGIYSVTLTASNAAGSDDEVKVGYITVLPSYCSSGATNTGDTDIGNVTFGSLTNGVATPTVNNATANKTYTNFTSLQPIDSFMQGVTYPFSVTQITSGGTFYEAYCNMFIDWNQDGVFDAVTERAYTGGLTSLAAPTLSANIAIPATATLGITRMRVILDENGTAADLACGTFSYGETEDYYIRIAPGLACSGTPAASDAAASDSTVCVNQSVTLSLTTSYSTIGLDYQWQSSLDGVNYTNITGATASTYTITQTSNTYYQCIVTCTNGGSFITSTAVYVTMNPFTDCYCSSAANNTADTDIGNVTFGNLNNGLATPITNNPTANGLYTNFTSLTPADYSRGSTYNFSMSQITSGATFYSAYCNVFIDWNQNGVFDLPAERVFSNGSTSGGNPTLTGTIAIPANATLGATRMRVVLDENGSATDPSCGVFSYGETEDYLINVIPCASALPFATGETVCFFTGTTLTASGNNIEWYDSATGGTLLGSGNTYTTGLISAPVTYYVQATDPTCLPSTRVAVAVAVQAAANAGTDGALTVCEGVIPTDADLFDALGGSPDAGGVWTSQDSIYTYTVTGTAPCPDATAQVVVSEIILNADLLIQNAICESANGAIYVSNPSGGTAPYTFYWDNASTADSLVGLSSGTIR